MVIFRYYKSSLFLFGITIIYKSKPFGKGGIYFLLLYIRLTILKNPLWSVLSLLVYNLFPLLHISNHHKKRICSYQLLKICGKTT